ncbi:MAG: hypothetical protein V1696_00580 [Candidatus Jorgensenbacteria bacterium]
MKTSRVIRFFASVAFGVICVLLFWNAGPTMLLIGFLALLAFIIGALLLLEGASSNQQRNVLKVGLLLLMTAIGVIIGWTNIGFVFVYGIGCIGTGFLFLVLALRFYPRRETAERFLEGTLRAILYLLVLLLGRGRNEPTEEKVRNLASHIRMRLRENLFT